MKKKGFTLIELLVVIAIIAMLLAILMPALNKVKKIAQRVVCGTNLKGLGTAQVVYANDYEDAFVVQSGTGLHIWAANTGGWQNINKVWANPEPITVGASLYLLVREADVSPKSFICPSGSETAYDGRNGAALDITELWDFGPGGQDGPIGHLSYSYHMPYAAVGGPSRFAADGTRSAAFAVMADKSPWYDNRLGPEPGGGTTQANYSGVIRQLAPYWRNNSLPKFRIESANAQPHSREGQNVSFGDGHSAYEKQSDVGVTHDNIYTIRISGGASIQQQEDNIRQGQFGPYGANDATFQPRNINDSFLVNDDVLGPVQ